MHDDNDECIYSLTPLNDNQMAYDMSVVNLRDGNFRWKKLPQLPIMEGQVVLSSCSFDNGGRCTTYYTIRIPNNIDDIHDDDFSVCTLHARNDITETQSQFQFQRKPQLVDTTDLINKLFGYDSKDAPQYALKFSYYYILMVELPNVLTRCVSTANIIQFTTILWKRRSIF